MVLRAFIDTIVSELSGGVQSDDRQLHPKLVYYTMLPIRSALITNKINKKQKISDWTYQTVPCIKLIEVDASLCPCIPPSGCTVMRSEKKLPKPLSGLTFLAIQGVYSSDMKIKFNYTTKSGFSRNSGGKYTSCSKSRNTFMIMDDYIYVYGEEIPHYVVMRAILYDPQKAYEFISACQETGNTIENPSSNCTGPLDMEFTIDPDLEAPLMDLTVQKLKENFLRQYSDKIAHNTTDED